MGDGSPPGPGPAPAGSPPSVVGRAAGLMRGTVEPGWAHVSDVLLRTALRPVHGGGQRIRAVGFDGALGVSDRVFRICLGTAVAGVPRGLPVDVELRIDHEVLDEITVRLSVAFGAAIADVADAVRTTVSGIAAELLGSAGFPLERIAIEVVDVHLSPSRGPARDAPDPAGHPSGPGDDTNRG